MTKPLLIKLSQLIKGNVTFFIWLLISTYRLLITEIQKISFEKTLKTSSRMSISIQFQFKNMF
jgi:hypothetical protein